MKNKKKPETMSRTVASLKRRVSDLEKRIRIMDQEVITRTRMRAAFTKAFGNEIVGGDKHLARLLGIR